MTAVPRCSRVTRPTIAVDSSDDLFATSNTKTSLRAHLTEAHAEQVTTCTAETIAAAASRVPPDVLNRAAGWLTGSEHYVPIEKPTPRRRHRSRAASLFPPDVTYVARQDLAWRNLLVSNLEFCALLNELHAAGVQNTQYGIHHPVGNLQVWCSDGPAATFGQPVQRWIHGAAWNTPATADEINRLRSRHLLGASRGVGIRLVRNVTTPLTERSVDEVANVLTTWVGSLVDRSRTLADLDQSIVQALQADVAFRTHV